MTRQALQSRAMQIATLAVLATAIVTSNLLRSIAVASPKDVVASASSTATAAATAATFVADVRPFLESHCIDCHDADSKKGGLDLDRFSNDAAVMADRQTWAAVLEKVESHQMPPPKRKAQPTAAERGRLVAFVSDIAARPDPQLGARDPGKPLLRRLTRLEYNNTVRDLLGLDIDLFMFPERLPIADKKYFRPASGAMGDEVRVPVRQYGARAPSLLPQAGLPGDNRAEHGYRNRGEAMNLSPLLLEKYLSVAGEIVNHPDLPRRSAAFAELLGVDRGGREKTAQPPRDRLARFIERAFRRPVIGEQVDRFFALFTEARSGGKSEADAMRVAAQAVLSSPSFLYLAESVEPAQGKVRPLDDFELACRLSYFLWASAPDAELLAAASAGKLHVPAELEAQARRMLKDPRARELSEAFAAQWLRLDQLYTAKPDKELFKSFYSGPQGLATLHAPMLVEPLLLFETVMVEDRSIVDFVDADYTWLNPQLAQLYGVPLPAEGSDSIAVADPVPGQPNRELKKDPGAGDRWRRVKLSDRTRGGFITMGGPLTVTSLPFRTSPVKRGQWLLETVFNRPPTEPKVAFFLKDDTKEAAAATSVRQKFEAHRSNPNCYTCHVRLDPPGFALEVFDPVGGYRTTDGPDPVDAKAEWNGRAFDGPAGFKAALAADPSEFARGFVEHLMSYALGRKLAVYDIPAIDAARNAVAEDGYRLSRVVVEVVKSYPFRFVRNSDAILD